MECICADGSAIPPLIIYKGESVQRAWVPPPNTGDTGNWAWTSNSKGWTCDNIGQQWVELVFEPATRAKANGQKRVLVCDGNGSHITAKFVRFCLDHEIVILVMPPHSSHLCQPLDVGVFSPLKQYMAAELDKIIRYGIPSVKKFEWADAYRHARQKAMSVENILGAWGGAGLIPFNRRKVLLRMSDFDERDCQSDIEITDDTEARPIASSSRPNPLAAAPSTPSRMDPGTLRELNTLLIANIEAGIFDTPTRSFIPKLAAFAEFASASD